MYVMYVIPCVLLAVTFWGAVPVSGDCSISGMGAVCKYPLDEKDYSDLKLVLSALLENCLDTGTQFSFFRGTYNLKVWFSMSICPTPAIWEAFKLKVQQMYVSVCMNVNVP